MRPAILEPGGAVRAWCSPPGGWSYIIRAGPFGVTVSDCHTRAGACFQRTVPRDRISAALTAAQVQKARSTGRLVPLGAHGFTLTQEDPEDDRPP